LNEFESDIFENCCFWAVFELIKKGATNVA